MSLQLEDLALWFGSAFALRKHGIRTIEQLLTYSPVRLRALKGMGEGRIEDIAHVLAQHGLKLQENEPPEVRTCLQCGSAFSLDHGRQKYCSQRCTGRAAQAMFRKRHREGNAHAT